MSEFLRYFLLKLENSFGLIMIAVAAAAVALIISYIVCKRKHNGKYPWGKAILFLLFAGYLGVLLCATVLRSDSLYLGERNLHLFRAWREAWNQFTVNSWANLLLNIALFVPLGALLPWIWKTMRKWYVAIPTGAGVSLAIELIQLVTGRGLFDVDDLLANSLGAAIGFCLALTVLSMLREKGKRTKPTLIYGICTGILIASVMGAFPIYGLQEYGNLPSAPCFTNRTSHVSWVLQCELPAAPEQMATYKSQKRGKKDCDRFAEAYSEMVGADFSDVYYYDEAAYYYDHGEDDKYHSLHLDYIGIGYEYSWGYSSRDAREPKWIEGTREELESALKAYGIEPPDYAEFSVQENGYHRFSINQHIDGSLMTDGTLLCRYAEDCTIREIDNHLGSYTYYDLVNIISPQ